MIILFELEPYGQEFLERLGLGSRAYYDNQGFGHVPYVGYFYSACIQDCIFILPKVFYHKNILGAGAKDKSGEDLTRESVIRINKDKNPLKESGLDKLIFELSVWIYRALSKFSERHPDSKIIYKESCQTVDSANGERYHTLLDIVMSLEKFHKDHSSLFTYISIVNSQGHNKIHWPKTISKTQPIIQNGIPFYIECKNKNKVFNYDEELIVLFYSVLQYLRHENMSSVRPNVNYNLMRPSKIKSMIENKMGTKLLRKIRRKYFKDELVQLWKLLYVFFDRSESIHSNKNANEALLATSFNSVFEDMIDALVGDPEFESIKKLDDGKIIDHIFKYKSPIDGQDIFYIGDSKYYSIGGKLDDSSIYKQFTYAKNIIQYHFKGEFKKESIRDDVTEGYNFIPNFFVSAYIPYDEKEEKCVFTLNDFHIHRLEDRPFDPTKYSSYHFENRLFDRDTLYLTHVNINLLFVIAIYARGDKSEQRAFSKMFKEDIYQAFSRLLNEKYDFYMIDEYSKEQMNSNFKQLNGKIYKVTGHDKKDRLILALEKGTDTSSYDELFSLNEPTPLSEIQSIISPCPPSK